MSKCKRIARLLVLVLDFWQNQNETTVVKKLYKAKFTLHAYTVS